MAENKLNLKIITPERILVNEEVDSVFSKAVDGEFGIMPGHIPFMTPLSICVTKYNKEGKEEYVSTIGGVFQVSGNSITILTENAELGEEIDVVRARAAKERAETRLRAGTRDVDVQRAEVALSRAIARIHAASRMR